MINKFKFKYKHEDNVKFKVLYHAVNDTVGFDICEKSTSRKRHLVDARGMFMYLASKYTSYSLSDIGKAFQSENYKGKDHATVLFQSRKVENLLYIKDPIVTKLYQECNELYYKRIAKAFKVHKSPTVTTVTKRMLSIRKNRKRKHMMIQMKRKGFLKSRLYV